MGKVRRKLFGEMGEMKKCLTALQIENRELRDKLNELTNSKTEWIYQKEDYLFDVKEHKLFCG
jgi:hypothetical protein